MVDLTRRRDDLGFMTRRVKRESAPSAPAAARATLDLSRPTPTAPVGLTLSASEPPVTPDVVQEASRLTPLPTATGNITLTDARPAVRMNRLSSAIGSLTITGALNVAWETTTGHAGLLDGEPQPPAPANRPLVERVGSSVIVGLRHARDLRRIILNGDDVALTTFAGHTVLNPGPADTCITVIDGVLEIRREPRSENLAETYSI